MTCATIVQEKARREVKIPSAFGEVSIEPEGVASVYIDGVPAYTMFYTGKEFIASLPPTVVKVKDVVDFSKIFEEKHYADAGKILKRTVIRVMAVAAGYCPELVVGEESNTEECVVKFMNDKVVKIRVEDYVGREHENPLFDDAIIVTAVIGKRSLTCILRVEDTPSGKVLNRILLWDGLPPVNEKEILYSKEVLGYIRNVPRMERFNKEHVIVFGKRYVRLLAMEYLKANGVL